MPRANPCNDFTRWVDRRKEQHMKYGTREMHAAAPRLHLPPDQAKVLDAAFDRAVHRAGVTLSQSDEASVYDWAARQIEVRCLDPKAGALTVEEATKYVREAMGERRDR